MRCAVVIAAALVVTGCATDPARSLHTLNSADVAYASPACTEARAAAAGFNDYKLARTGLGVAAGLLGPVGLPISLGSNVIANQRRKAMNDRVVAACTSPPAPPVLTDQRICTTAADGTVTCI